MSKKTLLQEESVRKFMKLANLNAGLSSNFINETYGEAVDEEITEAADEEIDLDVGASDDTEFPGDEVPELEGPELEGGEEEGAEVEAGTPMINLSEEDAELLFDALGGVVAELTGLSIDAEQEGGDLEGGDLEGADLGGPPGAEGAPDFVPADEPEDLTEITVIDEDAVVKETLSRVVSRLSNMNREEKLVERLAEKIQAKLARGK